MSTFTTARKLPLSWKIEPQEPELYLDVGGENRLEVASGFFLLVAPVRGQRDETNWSAIRKNQ